MDELVFGFNIAHFMTLNPTLENMPGFTQMKNREASRTGIFISTQ